MTDPVAATVRPTPDSLGREPETVAAYVNAILVLLVPVGVAVAGWRTWVHARRYRNLEGGGWQGVLEAGVVGFFLAIVILRRGIATRPADAPAYVIAYGGVAAAIGLTIGLVLRAAAVVTLKLASRRS